ncbi:methyltransferase [Micrococcales bacterium 31B]|nr:methyltransferase [Micrococcales bacterium 31B]
MNTTTTEERADAGATTNATPRASATTLDRLATLPVANIGDAMDRLGVVDARISAVWSGARLAGPAVTVEVAAGDNAGIHAAIEMIRPGDVLVVNGHGDENRALLGELIAERLRVRGCAGVVIDGAVRDRDDLSEIAFPVFARSLSPAGPFKNGPYRLGTAVAIGGVVVHPGDIVVGDGDGVAVVPRAEAAEVADRAELKHATEAETRRSIVASRID